MVKKIILAILLIVLGVVGFYVYKFATNKSGGFEGDKAQKVELKSATPLFDEGLKTVMQNYFDVKEAFVNADTATARASSIKMIAAIDSLKLDEIKKDTSGIFASVEPFIADTKGNIQRMIGKTDITAMRKDFDQANQQLFDLFRAIKTKYNGEPIYYHRCPMAFDGDKEAFWLDKKGNDAKTNPFLGKNHPVYKGTMINCGEQLDSVVMKK